MNQKAFAICCAILTLAAILYPSYTWGQEQIDRLVGIGVEAQQKIIAEHPDILTLPIKQREWRFGAKTMPKFLGSSTVILHRRYTSNDYILDIVLVLSWSLFLSAAAESWLKKMSGQPHEDVDVPDPTSLTDS